MRYIILAICIVLLPHSAIAWNTIVMGGGSVASSSESWSLQYNVDHASGTNYASIDGGVSSLAGTFFTASGSTTQVHSGTYSLSCPTRQDYISFDATTEAFYGQTGTMIIWAYFDTALNGVAEIGTLVGVQAQDTIKIRLSGTEAQIYYDTNDASSVTVITSGAGIAANGWYKFVAKWRVTSSPYLYVAVYNSSETLLDSAEHTSSINSWTTSISYGIFGFTNYQDPQYGLYVDDIEIYETWE